MICPFATRFDLQRLSGILLGVNAGLPRFLPGRSRAADGGSGTNAPARFTFGRWRITAAFLYPGMKSAASPDRGTSLSRCVHSRCAKAARRVSSSYRNSRDRPAMQTACARALRPHAQLFEAAPQMCFHGAGETPRACAACGPLRPPPISVATSALAAVSPKPACSRGQGRTYKDWRLGQVGR
jgi:hypothetical protein